MATTACALCMAVHTGPCSVPMKRGRSQDDFVTPVKKPASQHVCQTCGSPATDLCICTFPPTILCSGCVQMHRMGTPDDTHNMFPESEYEKIDEEQECLRARVWVIVQSAAVKQLYRGLPDINAVERDVTGAYDAVIAHIEGLKARQISYLRRIQTDLKQLIMTAAQATRLNILDRAYQPKNDIEKVIWDSTEDTDPATYRLFAVQVTHNYPVETLQDPVKVDLTVFPTALTVDIPPLSIGPPPEGHELLSGDSLDKFGEDSQGTLQKLKYYKTNLICFQAYERTQQIVEEEMEMHLIEDGKKLAVERAKLLFEKFCGEKLNTVPQEFLGRLAKWTERTYSRYLTVATLERMRAEQSEGRTGVVLGAKCNYCEKYTQQGLHCKCGKMSYCGQECLSKDEAFHSCP